MTGVEEAILKAGGQAALAALCGVNQPAVSKWAKRGYVSQRVVIMLSRDLDIPVARLVSPALRRLIEKVEKVGK